MDISLYVLFVIFLQEEKIKDFPASDYPTNQGYASGKVYTYNLWLFKFAMHHFKVCALLSLTVPI
jgi:hypothetical protein